MIHFNILKAIKDAPDIAQKNPDITLTTTNPLQVALLTYTCDVLLSELPGFVKNTDVPLPEKIMLSFVAERKEGQLVLASWPSKDNRVERDDLEDFAHAMKLKLVCSALEDSLDQDHLQYFEAMALTKMSSHARLDLIHRLQHYARYS